jgi:lipopolysaccharide export system protein LptA
MLLSLRGAASVVLTLATISPALAQRDVRVLPGGNARSPIEVEAENLEYVTNERKIIYTGNVYARQGEATLRSSKLTIFLVEAQTQPARNAVVAAPDTRGGLPGGEVKRMEASGPVIIASKDHIGHGDRGVYEKALNRVRLIGHVRLNKGVQSTRGGPNSSLVYDLNSGHAQLVGGVNSVYTPGDKPLTRSTSARKPKS